VLRWSCSHDILYTSIRNNGITTEYPYQQKQQPFNLPINKTIVDIDDYVVLATYESSVRIAVTHQPVVASIRIDNDL
jgi:hypothetical protein